MHITMLSPVHFPLVYLPWPWHQVHPGILKQLIAMSRLDCHRLTDHNKPPTNFAGIGVENALRNGLKKVHLIMTPNGIHSRQNQYPLKKVNNKLEFLYNWRYYDKNLTMFWISFCGTHKEAKEYEHTIKILC